MLKNSSHLTHMSQTEQFNAKCEDQTPIFKGDFCLDFYLLMGDCYDECD